MGRNTAAAAAETWIRKFGIDIEEIDSGNGTGARADQGTPRPLAWSGMSWQDTKGRMLSCVSPGFV